MKAAHKLLAEYEYELLPVERGYANRTLYINLETLEIKEKPVTQQMKDLFTGGRGFGLKLLWDAVTPETQWDDPENELVIANGPICGTTAYAGSGKATVVTLSPLTHNVVDSNVGGYFAPFLKFSGFDALEIQGKADEDVVIFIDGDTGRVSVETAPLEHVDSHLLGAHLTRMYAEDEKSQRNISVMSAGDAAEHIRYAIINSTWYDVRRKEIRLKQAGRGGTGRVFRDKKIKGLVVRYSSVSGKSNGPANMELLRKAGKRFNREMSELDDAQNNMRKVGTSNIVEIMDHFDLLPVHNFRFGSHSDRYTQNRLEGLDREIRSRCTRRLLAGMHHVLLARRGRFPRENRSLRRDERARRWSRIRECCWIGREYWQFRSATRARTEFLL